MAAPLCVKKSMSFKTEVQRLQAEEYSEEEEGGTDVLLDLSEEKRKREEAERKRISQVEFQHRMEEEGVGNRAANFRRVLTSKVDPSHFTGVRLQLHRLLTWWVFDTVIGMVIVFNAVTIGLETQAKAAKPFGCDMDCNGCLDPLAKCTTIPAWLDTCDTAFLVVYTIEISLRFYVYGIFALRSNWIKFDLFLVSTSFLDKILKEFAVKNDILAQLMLVRMLRLARLARAIRLMVQFRVLWQLVQGLMHSMGTLIWTFLLLMIMMYVFAIVGM
ncbi:unnamed protein product, partial [Polarella glacialis]